MASIDLAVDTQVSVTADSTQSGVSQSSNQEPRLAKAFVMKRSHFSKVLLESIDDSSVERKIKEWAITKEHFARKNEESLRRFSKELTILREDDDEIVVSTAVSRRLLIGDALPVVKHSTEVNAKATHLESICCSTGTVSLIGIAEGSDSYGAIECLSSGILPYFSNEGEFDSNGGFHRIVHKIGGDMVFLLEALGYKGPNSTYWCATCETKD